MLSDNSGGGKHHSESKDRVLRQNQVQRVGCRAKIFIVDITKAGKMSC